MIPLASGSFDFDRKPNFFENVLELALHTKRLPNRSSITLKLLNTQEDVEAVYNYMAFEILV